MDDKQVASEKILRQLLDLLEKEAKKDKDTVIKLWQKMMPPKKDGTNYTRSSA